MYHNKFHKQLLSCFHWLIVLFLRTWYVTWCRKNQVTDCLRRNISSNSVLKHSRTTFILSSNCIYRGLQHHLFFHLMKEYLGKYTCRFYLLSEWLILCDNEHFTDVCLCFRFKHYSDVYLCFCSKKQQNFMIPVLIVVFQFLPLLVTK